MANSFWKDYTPKNSKDSYPVYFYHQTCWVTFELIQFLLQVDEETLEGELKEVLDTNEKKDWSVVK